ncbi:MAG: DUF1778 domain-containing protein [Gammaproteobacteria bacterium]|nr:MAG: DUF1778 domain-containing protein [Gammaproteobacteria bacterium]
MTTARLDMRLDKAVKTKAEKAMALLGHKSLTEYVVKLMDQDATKVIAQHENMTVEDDVFDRFWAACNKVNEPNLFLREADEHYKAQGFE